LPAGNVFFVLTLPTAAVRKCLSTDDEFR